MNIALLMMGGSGTRFGAEIPKQFVMIGGKPVFSYILKGLEDVDLIDAIIIVVHRDWIDYVNEWADRLGAVKVRGIVPGGATRSESVLCGLEKANAIAGPEDIVMMHDAAHPYVDPAGIGELIGAVREYGGATLGQRQYDTCYRIDDDDMLREVIPRKYVVSGASPEAFRLGDIYRIYKNAAEDELERMTSAGSIALANGIKMKVCTLNSLNLKITYSEDMKILQELMTSYFFPDDQDITPE